MLGSSPEVRISVERLLDRLADISVSESRNGAAGARRYEYAPTYIPLGVQKLDLEFTPFG